MEPEQKQAERRRGGLPSQTSVRLLTALVAALQWLAGAMPCNENAPSGMNTADVFAEVSLAGVALLPLLCEMADSPATSTPSTIALTILTRTFLAPPTYLEALRNHFHLATQIASIGPPGPATWPRTQALLNLLLSLASSSEGLTFLLQSADLASAMSQLAAFTSSPTTGTRGHVPSMQSNALSCSTVALLTKLLHGGGEGPGAGLLRQVLGLTAEHRDWLCGPLLAVMPSVDILGVTSSSGGKPYDMTLAGLAHARLVLLLLLELGKHRREWFKFHADVVNACIRTTQQLVTSLAADGQWDASAVPPQRCPLQCRPTTPSERARVAMHAPLGLNKGWFSLAAHAAKLPPPAPPRSTSTGTAAAAAAASASAVAAPLPPPSTSSFSSSSALTLITTGRGSAFSEDVAVGVYQLILLGLSFLCQLTGDMVHRLAEGATVQLQGVSQGLLLIPQTSTLHAIQEQCLAVAAELASKEVVSEAAARLCRTAVACVERALLLEACHPRLPWTAAVSPSHLTAHAFAKWHKAFTTAAKSRPELAEAVESLEVAIPLVHPSLLL